MRHAEGVSEPGVRRRLVDGVEVGAHEVLCERELQGVAARLGGRTHDRRDAAHARALGGPEAPLAGDEPVAVAIALHDDRVQEPVQADRLGHGVETGIVEVTAWLLGIGRDLAWVDRDQHDVAVLVPRRSGKKGVQSPAEAAPAEAAGGVVHAVHGARPQPVAAPAAPSRRRWSRLNASSRYAMAPRQPGS